MYSVEFSLKNLAASFMAMAQSSSSLHFLVSCFVGQTLSFDTLKRDSGALSVVNTKLGAIILAEIKFSQVTIKVLFIDVLIDANQAMFENRKEAFKGVGMNVPARPFKLGMIDAFMLRNGRVSVVCRFVDYEAAISVNVLVEVGHDAAVIENHGADVTATLYEAQNSRVRLLTARPAFGLARVGECGFVGFNRLTSAAHRAGRAGGHNLADTMAEEPSGFHAAIKHPLNLASGDTFLARAKQVNDLKPEMQREMAVLENRSHANREGLLARVALVKASAGGLAVQAANARRFTAMGARRAARPKRGFHIRESGFLRFEMRGRKNGISHGVSSYG
jgi:hypothetical protein